MYKQWAGYSIGYVALANRYAEWLIYMPLLVVHKPNVKSQVLLLYISTGCCRWFHASFRSPRLYYSISPPSPTLFKMSYISSSSTPTLIHFQHDLSCLQKVSLIYLYLCCCFLDCCIYTFFFLLFCC